MSRLTVRHAPLPDVDARPLSDGFLGDIEARAIQIVGEAGRMALERFWQPFRVEFKRDRADPVTDVDREVETFLRSAISREFPDHGIVGEEGAELDSADREFVWALDPVDGTTNFVNGLPLFCCSAALLHRGVPVVGAIFLPGAPRVLTSPGRVELSTDRPVAGLRSAVLHARVGGGAYMDGVPVHVSDASQPDPSCLAGLPGRSARRFWMSRPLRANPGEVRSLGSICYEAALVACGVLRYALFAKPKLWDVAAAALIVRESGGQTLYWRDSHWEPLGCFEPMRNPEKPGEIGLRFWTAITLVGGAQVARFVAERLRPEATLRERVARLIR